MINHFKNPIMSMSSGIPWMKRNPAQKLFVVLYGESVAITPKNKDNGVMITFNPKAYITNDNFLLLIFGKLATPNKIITRAIKIIKNPYIKESPKTSTS